jgi:hypothetical protein
MRLSRLPMPTFFIGIIYECIETIAMCNAMTSSGSQEIGHNQILPNDYDMVMHNDHRHGGVISIFIPY